MIRKKGPVTFIHSMLCLLVCFSMFIQPAKAGSFDISAYFKTYSMIYDEADAYAFPGSLNRIMGVVNNRLRTSINISPADRLSFQIAHDFSPRIMDTQFLNRSFSGMDVMSDTYRAIDIDNQLYPRLESEIASFRLYQNLDRLNMELNTDLADIYIGRQAIAWGSARAVNPTDIIAPFSYDDLDVEDRVGVDAVRVRVPIGFMGEIDMGHVFGDDFHIRNSATFLRARFYEWRTDISPISIAFQKNMLIGIDLSRSIGGAGTWLEAAHVVVNAFDSEQRSSDDDYFRLSIGLDYGLRNGSYLFAEYHYNGAGTDTPEQYLTQAMNPAYADGAVYLLGQHYFIPGMSYNVTPLITAIGETLINLTDPSLYIAPKLEYSVSEDTYLSVGAFIGVGESVQGPANQPFSTIAIPKSEFGLYPDIYYVSVRVYL